MWPEQRAWTRVCPFYCFLGQLFLHLSFFFTEQTTSKSRASRVYTFSQLTDNLELSQWSYYSFFVPSFFLLPHSLAVLSAGYHYILWELYSFSRLRGPRQRIGTTLGTAQNKWPKFCFKTFQWFHSFVWAIPRKGGPVNAVKNVYIAEQETVRNDNAGQDRWVHPSQSSGFPVWYTHAQRSARESHCVDLLARWTTMHTNEDNWFLDTGGHGFPIRSGHLHQSKMISLIWFFKVSAFFRFRNTTGMELVRSESLCKLTSLPFLKS